MGRRQQRSCVCVCVYVEVVRGGRSLCWSVCGGCEEGQVASVFVGRGGEGGRFPGPEGKGERVIDWRSFVFGLYVGVGFLFFLVLVKLDRSLLHFGCSKERERERVEGLRGREGR